MKSVYRLDYSQIGAKGTLTSFAIQARVERRYLQSRWVQGCANPIMMNTEWVIEMATAKEQGYDA